MTILGKFDKQPREVEIYAFKFDEDMSETDDVVSGYCALMYGTKPVPEITVSTPYTATLTDSGSLVYTSASVTLPGSAPIDYRLMVANTSQNAAISVGAFSVPARGSVIVHMTSAGWTVEMTATSIIVAAPDDQRLRIQVAGGLDKNKYKVQATVATSEGRILEDELILSIKED